MQTKVKKWGNSIALRIPRAFVEELQLAPDTPVELSLVEGKLLISPLPVYSLDDLLGGISDDMLHGETDTGTPVGLEEW